MPELAAAWSIDLGGDSLDCVRVREVVMVVDIVRGQDHARSRGDAPSTDRDFGRNGSREMWIDNRQGQKLAIL